MKRAIFIGQAMPRFKKDLHDWPSLNAWLHSIGIGIDQIRNNFFYSALVDYFPGAKNGSHIVPTDNDVRKERPRLITTIREFDPQIVVPIGRLSISHCLRQPVAPLSLTIGKIYTADPYFALGRDIPIIPLPHPSGASIWHHSPANKKLLRQALNLLKQLL